MVLVAVLVVVVVVVLFAVVDLGPPHATTNKAAIPNRLR
ncbi:hypothetical protein JCM19275_1622 [Nonlabens ulvanivorans]|uniref:Uncharacterized protein n=1 Tax=Nonlabens ulvanivorans TaxID=906888 RepID=A0A090WK05_NONUL|nr:hypothetical protein JCM19275_1622 [Nonlabens ulvanivorans]